MPTKEVADYQLSAIDLTADQRRRAVLAVASAAGDAAECAEFLAMLGLRAGEGVIDVPMPRG